jgi:single-strand DNA-binding protein
MNGKTPLTITGNLTADPELRFTPSGAAVANFTVASTPRTFNQTTNQWEDGQALFLRCAVWREQAENVAESLHKGDRVVVTGTLVQRNWETEDKQKRSTFELEVDDVAASLRFARATVKRLTRQQDPKAA